MISIAWFLLNKSPKHNEILSGIFVGITASLRPPFVLLFIPFLAFGRYLFILGGLIGFSFSLILSLSVVDLVIWQKYVLAMLGMTGFVNLRELVPVSTNAITGIVYPKIVEGFITSRNPLERRNFVDSSIFDVLNGLGINNRREIVVIGFIITIVFLTSYLIKYNFKNTDLNFILLYGILLCLIGEFFIPVGRYPYYDIQLMLPLLIIVSRSNINDLISNKLIAILILGLLLSLGCFVWIKKFLFFSSITIVFYITVISLMLLRHQAKRTATGNHLWRLP